MNIGDNFNYEGRKFLDSRQGKPLTLADLQNWDTLIPIGFEVFVSNAENESDNDWYVYMGESYQGGELGHFRRRINTNDINNKINKLWAKQFPASFSVTKDGSSGTIWYGALRYIKLSWKISITRDGTATTLAPNTVKISIGSTTYYDSTNKDKYYYDTTATNTRTQSTSLYRNVTSVSVWDSTRTYAENNEVRHNGFVWISKSNNNVGNTPADNSNYWVKYGDNSTSNPIVTKTINNEINSFVKLVIKNDTTVKVNYSFIDTETNTTYSGTSEVKYDFCLKKFYGVSSKEIGLIDETDVTSWSSEFATSFNVSFNASISGSEKYIYYIIPSSLYKNHTLTLAGLPQATTKVRTDQTLVFNGYSAKYVIISSEQKQGGDISVSFKEK